MQNLPRITAPEIALVVAAMVLLYFVPAVLAWNDARRQRRATREAMPPLLWTAPPELPPVLAPVVEDDYPTAWPTEAPSFPAAADAEMAAAPTEAAALAPAVDQVIQPEAMPAAPPVPEPETPPTETTVAAEILPPMADLNGGAALAIEPLNGASNHRFRLEDLRRARLPAWPPAVVRDDPGRYRVWGEALRVVEQQWATIGAAMIGSPYPARSTCLGAAAMRGAVYRLQFLLFPALWPTAPEQSVAQAVFEVDPAARQARGWVEALPALDLTADQRREIEDSGGQL